MAAVASSICGGEAVIVVDVAKIAGRSRMCAGESPARRRVIEHAGVPGGGVVTGGTEGTGETGCNVIWNVAAESCRAVPGGLMAAIAIGVGRSEVVIIVHVTLSAGSVDVRASQRKASRAVIECGGSPGDGVMARGAIRRGERGACS